MKGNKPMKFGCIISIALFCWIGNSCTKPDDSPNNGPVTEINLFNRSLDSAKYYVVGDWKVVFEDGGYAALQFHYNDMYMHIFQNDSISWTQTNMIIARSKITWKKIRYYNTADSISVWQYTDYGTGGRISLYPVKKRNDTLILSNYGSDGSTYFLVPR